MGDPRFLLHVTQADRWPAVISNLRNLADQGLSRRVRVMINGTAIYAVQGDNDWTEAMREAAQDGTVRHDGFAALPGETFDDACCPRSVTAKACLNRQHVDAPGHTQQLTTSLQA